MGGPTLFHLYRMAHGMMGASDEMFAVVGHNCKEFNELRELICRFFTFMGDEFYGNVRGRPVKQNKV